VVIVCCPYSPLPLKIGSAIGFFFFAFVPVHGPSGTLIPLAILAGVGWLGAVLFWVVRLQPVYNDEAHSDVSSGIVSINHT
jgi:hypothetical protein